MFDGFANLWTIVGLARDLPRDALLPMRIAGERVVLFRNAAGKASALIDRCPHRGVALSLGKLRDGILECPFHGWRFDGNGANCHVPWNPDAKRELLGATAVPVREAAGLLWLYTGFEPADEPRPSESLLQPGVVLCAQSALWNTHWTRAMENMLDSPHLPFVHQATIGRFVAKHVGGRMDVSWTDTPYGARIENTMEGRERGARLDYRSPNAMELFIDFGGRLFRLMAVCVPVDDSHTQLTIITLRNFARWRGFDWYFRRSNRKIADEDKAILESSDPVAVPPPAQEKSVRTDKPTLAFRKLYFERFEESSATAPRPAG
ncbi:MAG TPA: aromatic ring-hydroxylating dioxygenase subunit alpha [Croceibacterium sp.]|jgi:phenylpropionate dioxygenase-like ring-hydroxylating dioxygenase large terminal subunit